ncbi:hypothetical protein [Agrobacterium cavarae]|uniref:hypothetical protein n=1 Tax=Agrobacterium cavarae TaxID=2528239 RepID=UPI0013EF2E2D|nr:hypothetical protein [Agrobacterium cavarae]
MDALANRRLDSAMALSEKKFCVAFSEAEYDAMYSIILVYEGDYEEPWTGFGIPRIIDSVTGWIGKDGKPVVFAKSDEGDVYHLSAGTEPKHSKIIGSGVYIEDTEGLGYTSRIVAIGDTLLVTGHNSQLYIREGEQWTWFNRDKLPMPSEEFDHLVFGAIAGSSLDDLYMTVTCMPKASGRNLTEEEEERAAELFDLGRPDEALAIHYAAEGETKVMEGRLYHWNGTDWKLVATPRYGQHYPHSAVLSDVFVEAPDKIWAVGENGVILKGNAKSGFRDVSFKGDDADLRSIARFGDSMILASDYALHSFDGHILSPLKPTLDPSVNKNVPNPLKVQAIADTLYYFDRARRSDI